MQFSTKALPIDKARTGCVVVPVLAGGKLGATAGAIDAATGKRLAAALATGDLASKAGSTLLVHLEGPVARALLVATGDKSTVDERAYAQAARGAFRSLRGQGARDAIVLLHEVEVEGRDLDWKIRNAALAAREAAYRFDRFKSKPDTTPAGPASIAFAVDKADQAAARTAAARATAIANGMDLARDLGNTPGNVCTPTYLAQAARELGREFDLKVQVLGEKQMTALKMNALLAVARGSAQPPQLITLEYRGGPARQAPVALVGKGITFDTGGISLKPAGEMDEMKWDMSGAASVLGTVRAVAEMKLPINLVGIIAAAENMPGSQATRPGDIVTSMSGQTIEILNTDAEGRLVLCDALTYAARFKPGTVIDIATLTGACVVALGKHHSGLFSRGDALAGELLAAGSDMADTCWRMPLDEEYQELLKSPFADVANIGGRYGGAITAACFLARFTKDYDWAHLDIAGTAWNSGASKGSTGRPVPLLTGFLMNRARS
ncbi:MAG: leucyl aminopeptidase [Burkholderiaceae bacterium]|jgi:leucyl aminopeptidase|nr:leucyl aminopeptidase [Burkholderiaceae bacterium]MEB2320454.1 leucyl aminopeptidase [Pseudomonadota bacterium]